MQTFKCRPHPLLRPYIDRFWGWEGKAGETLALPTLLPGTGAEIFFHHGTPFRQAHPDHPTTLGPNHLLCLRHRPLPLAPARGVGFVAIRFRAGGLGHLAEPPGALGLDQALPVEALWGRAGRELAEQVAEAPDFAARCRRLQHFLLQRLEKGRGDTLVGAAVRRLYRQPEATAVAALAADLEVGRRQLERRFLAQEGLSPVEFRRRVRFQKTVRRLLLEPALPVLEAALDQGYYDQSHFHRDFVDLAGQAPARHLAAARAATHFYNTPEP